MSRMSSIYSVLKKKGPGDLPALQLCEVNNTNII